jgi:hypothetical protein
MGKPKTIPGRLVEDFDHCEKAGDFFFAGARLSFLCPCGCGVLCGIRVDDSDPYDRGIVWKWNNSKEKPTCDPSIMIHANKEENHWHGYLKDGAFIEC